MDLPDCINYKTVLNEEEKGLRTPYEVLQYGALWLQYLKKEDLETTPIENIIKMSKGYLEYDNPILYRLYLHLNPNLKTEKVEMIEDKIKELLELHIIKQNEISEQLNNK